MLIITAEAATTARAVIPTIGNTDSPVSTCEEDVGALLEVVLGALEDSSVSVEEVPAFEGTSLCSSAAKYN